jgi:CubicO group peptidase (beta-lactamase class C family)
MKIEDLSVKEVVFMNASISKAGCNNRSADRVSGLCPNRRKARMARVIVNLVILLSCFCLVFTSCEKNKEVIGPLAGQYEVPLQIDDGWETASLFSVGMDEAPLLKLLQKLTGTVDHRIHSLLIVKDGKLVFEEYFPGEKFKLAQPTGEFGFDMYDTHTLCSVTKSVTSALIGIAIDQDFIQSVDQKVFDFFPEHSDLLTSAPEKNALTLEHLLTMTSGLQWDDESTSYFDPRNDLYQLFRSQDPIRYILSKDLLMVPGTVFDYANCNTNVLGEIVRKASEDRLDHFAANYLFSKLGITDFEWQMLPNDVVFCSGDLMLRPRDMAKFGYLFLNDGIWNGEQVISQEWVHLSTQKIIDLEEYSASYAWADGYGYQWWLWEDIYGVEYQAYLAAGWGGQWIIVCPSMNTVVVSTAGNYYTNTKIPIEEILVDYIIPSIS